MKLAVILSCCLLGTAAASAEPDCVKTAKLKVGGHERVITLVEANKVKSAVDRYWPEAKPKMDPHVFAPGEPFIDCFGTIRMGLWILETARSDEPELRLTYRIVTNDLLMLRQVISLKQVNGRWKAMDVGTETFHRLQ